MNVHPNYRTASILLKLAIIITLFHDFIIQKLQFDGFTTMILIGMQVILYVIARLVQNGKAWTRYPVLAIAILSLANAVFTFYVSLPWILTCVASLGLQSWATVLLFKAKVIEIPVSDNEQ